MPVHPLAQTTGDSRFEVYLGGLLPSLVRPIVFLNLETKVSRGDTYQISRHFIIIPGVKEVVAFSLTLEPRRLKGEELANVLTPEGMLAYHRGLALTWLNKHSADLYRAGEGRLPFPQPVELQSINPFDLSFFVQFNDVAAQLEEVFAKAGGAAMEGFARFFQSVRYSSAAPEKFQPLAPRP